MAIALLAICLFAGCGDGEGQVGASSQPISKASFIAKADKICASAQKRIAAGFRTVGREHAEHFQVAKVAMMEEVAIPALQSQVERIRALGAPNGDQREVEAILSATQKAIDQGAQELARSYSFYRETARLARAYGLQDCAVG